VKEGVNFVNALPLARERGIQVTTRTAQAADYSGQIAVTVTTGGRQHTVSGVLFGANNPRIVRLDEFHFDARPQGHLIVIENEDKPGVIGNVGAMVGAAGINIARMGFGRENKGGKAISIVEADSRPEKGLLDSLAKLPNINRVTLVTLPD
jgi:D-3-phosphoglycerate dehydrogenase